MRNDPSNKDLRTRVSQFLDRELNQEDEQSFLQDAKQNQDLGRALEQEQKIRKLIKDNTASPGVPEGLIERIKNQFR